MRTSRRLDALGEYVMTRINRVVYERREAGEDVISLGMGDPDQLPTARTLAALTEALGRPDVHAYPVARGTIGLRSAVADYYARRFGVELDPEREVLPLLGAKEGLAHLALALLDPGDAAIVADPGYPVYAGGPTIAGAEPVPLPLLRQNDFQPDFDAIDAAVVRRANLLLFGYPNNPTGALARAGLFADAVAFGRRHGIPVCHDNAYAEIVFDGATAPSFLETPGAKDVGIELLSLSKAFRIPGWRIAFAVGNADLVQALGRLKTNVDSGMFSALQRAAVTMLAGDGSEQAELCAVYERRRDLLCGIFERAGLDVVRPQATLYLWLPVPGGGSSAAFAERLVERADVVVAPGIAYGAHGEGFVRVSMTQPDERLVEAAERIIAVV